MFSEAFPFSRVFQLMVSLLEICAFAHLFQIKWRKYPSLKAKILLPAYANSSFRRSFFLLWRHLRFINKHDLRRIPEIAEANAGGFFKSHEITVIVEHYTLQIIIHKCSSNGFESQHDSYLSHPFIHSFIRASIHPFIYSFTHPSTNSSVD